MWLGFNLKSNGKFAWCWICFSLNEKKKMVFVQPTLAHNVHQRNRLWWEEYCAWCCMAYVYTVYLCLSFHQCIHNSLISGGIYFWLHRFRGHKSMSHERKKSITFFFVSSSSLLSESVWEEFITKNMVFILAQKKKRRELNKKKCHLFLLAYGFGLNSE